MGMTQKLAAPPGKYCLCIWALCLPSLQLNQVEIKRLAYLGQHALITDSNQSFSKLLTEQY